MQQVRNGHDPPSMALVQLGDLFARMVEGVQDRRVGCSDWLSASRTGDGEMQRARPVWTSNALRDMCTALLDVIALPISVGTYERGCGAQSGMPVLYS